MSAPWMKWYPSDWRSDPRLRMCSLAARGLWAEMICLMHEAEPYGSLLVNGSAVTEKQLASLVGAAPREVKALIAELEGAGVFSRDAEVIFSRRMRRDAEKAERDKANGKGGGNPRLKAGVNPKVKAQSPEARSQPSEPNGSGVPPPSDPKAEYFKRGRQVLGDKAGGVLSKLLKSQGNEDDPKAIAKARARIEDASAKAKPSEWIGRILAGPQLALMPDGQPHPEGIV